MQRAELVIVLAILLVGAAAFGLERLGPDAVRVIAISFCGLLIAMMVLGFVVRVRMKRAREGLAATAEDAASPEPPGAASGAALHD